MSEVDASIPLAVKTPNLAEAWNTGVSEANTNTENRIKIGQELGDVQDQKTLKDAFAKGDPTTPEGMNDILTATKGKVSPKITIGIQDQQAKMLDARAQMVERLAKATQEQFKAAQEKAGLFADLTFGLQTRAKAIDDQLQEEVKNGTMSSDKANEMAQTLKDQAWQETIRSAGEQGLISGQQLGQIPNKYDPNFVAGVATQSKTGQAVIAEAQKERAERDRVAQEIASREASDKRMIYSQEAMSRREDTRERSLERREASREADQDRREAAREADQDRRNNKVLQEQVQVPDPDNPGKMKTETHDVNHNLTTGAKSDLGVSASKSALGGFGGALQQKAALQLADSGEVIQRAIENVNNMPGGTTGQVFHFDKTGDILSAPKEIFKGEITSDAASEYNRHIQGIGLEMTLMKNPYSARSSEGLSKEFQDKYYVKPGQSKYQMYLSLADLKQDLQASNAALQASGLPDATKKEFRDLMASVNKEVPYDVKSLQEIRYKGQARVKQESAQYLGKTPGKNPPLSNSKGWTLQQDGKGNMAYVSPDRKQFEEVK